MSAAMLLTVAFGVPVESAPPVVARRSAISGNARFVTGRNGDDISVVARRNQPTPAEFLAQHGHLFGVTDAETQLRLTKTKQDHLGLSHTTYQQWHDGVRVFAGELKVHQRPTGAIYAANGAFRHISAKVDTTPGLTMQRAADAARMALRNMDAEIEEIELVIVDPGWYGDAVIGPHLAFHVILRDLSKGQREAFFVEAHDGRILDRWSMVHTARVREVYDGMQTADLPGTLSRAEGDPPVSNPEDVDRAYDYAGDVYQYFSQAFGRDSIDANGMTMILTVNSQYPPCANAQWNGSQMIFCTGTVTDDITAHEITHGVTDFTADLIYQNQAGQLNESYSDIFGELIDLFNGEVAFPGPPSGTSWPTHATGPGQDTPNNLRSACSFSPDYVDGVRWLMGEDADAFGGSIRDMWDPTCEGHPDTGNSGLQTCPGNDNGGVHSGSGVPNHAFAILVDGKSFNGFEVASIGPIKAGAVWYLALTNYLTVSSDFEDAYDALNQAALDLVGTDPNDPRTGLPSGDVFTAFDAQQVDLAMQAVEMNSPGACGATVAILNPAPPTECGMRNSLFADDFESGNAGWTTSIIGAPQTPYDWELSMALPAGRAGSAWYCLDFDDGCPAGGEESAAHRLESPSMNVPAGAIWTRLRFDHYVATEPLWDGGNVKISINGGSYEVIPGTAFLYNGYNATMNGGDNTNPLAEEPGFSGVGGGWGTSLVELRNLVEPGDSFRIAFDFGKDYCNGVDGWYIDDLEVYACTCNVDGDCADSTFCNGAEVCNGGFCDDGPAPCAGYCDENAGTCPPTALWDDFENGNVNGWDQNAPDSEASTGEWTFDDPIGTTSGGLQAQPELAYAGQSCAFTQQNTSLGGGDVDGGVVYLESPVLDLDGQTSVELRYVRWFFQSEFGNDANDFFSVEASDDGGASWNMLELLGPDERANEWTPVTVMLDSAIDLTANVKIRFGASDGTGSGEIVEGAVDDVVVVLTGLATCDSPIVTADSGRTFAIAPAPGIEPVALRIRGDGVSPEYGCLDAYVQLDGSIGPVPAFQLPDAWNTVHPVSEWVAPDTTYLVETVCQGGATTSDAVPVTTWSWGDADDDGLANFADVLLLAQAFQSNFANVTLAAADLDPCLPNGLVNFADILRGVQAFQQMTFSDAGCAIPCP